jgi:hypothetical protein
MLTIPVVAAILGASPVAACPNPPEFQVTVVAIHQQVARGTDLDLAGIEELRRREGTNDQSRALGIYQTHFGYTVQVLPEGDPCSASIRVTVRLMLFDRQIQIARDLIGSDCVSAALAHYERRAAADDAILGELAQRVRSVLQPARLLPPSQGLPLSDLVEQDVETRVRSAVDKQLPWYDKRYTEAQQTLSGPVEMKQLDTACGN